MGTCQIRHINTHNVAKARDVIPEIQEIQSLADMFKALGDPTRLKIVTALVAVELCVCDLSAVCGLSESAISHQLRILRNLRIVKYRREGKIVYYRLDDDHVESLVRQSLAHIFEDQRSPIARKPEPELE
jgi:ArsR family transcriptional regulator, lead/cadmium/zinc/bismuth-responsive transcriptional repressor